MLYLRVRQREEIINACEQLYQTMNFREITLKEIGSITSFSRLTIYNYFQTKEDIFLALFRREYDRWNEDLAAILDGSEQLTKKQLAEEIAKSLAGRQQLLRLLSMNTYDMEANSRQELLTGFKVSYGVTMTEVSLAWLLSKVTSPVVGATKLHHIEGAAKAVDLELTPEEILYLEELYVPHPLAGVMAQNKPAAAKEKHVWSTGDQKIGRE